MEQGRNNDYQGNTEDLGEKLATVPLRPQQLLFEFIWD
jgi:hypothetical protein